MQKVIFSVILGVCCQTNAWADDAAYQTDRYTLLKTTPTFTQDNPLEVVVSTTIPQSISSVQGAIDFLLVRSGYRLASGDAIDPAMASLMQLPLPEAHRHIDKMSLISVLRMLSAPAYVPIVDPVHRLIAFDLKAEYKAQQFLQYEQLNTPNPASPSPSFEVESKPLIEGDLIQEARNKDDTL